MWGNLASSIPATPGIPPQARPSRIFATDELAIHHDAAVYTVDGSGTVTHLPPWPRGFQVRLAFTGSPKFVNSSRLKLNGGRDITFSPDDVVDALSLGDGNWKIIPLVTMVTDRYLIGSGNLPAAANLDVALPAGYDAVEIEIIGMSGPADAATVIYVSNDGVTFPSANYAYVGEYLNTTSTAPNVFKSQSGASIVAGLGLASSNCSARLSIRIDDYLNPASYKVVKCQLVQQDNSGSGYPEWLESVGSYMGSAAAVAALRVYLSPNSGTAIFSSGTYRVYGLKKK